MKVNFQTGFVPWPPKGVLAISPHCGEIAAIAIAAAQLPSEAPHSAARKGMTIDMEDIFLRADSFAKEPWYEEFQLYLRIGICKPLAEHKEAAIGALQQMGYQPVERQMYNATFLVEGKAHRSWRMGPPSEAQDGSK